MATDCSSCGTADPLFDASKSSTFTNSSVEVSKHYGIGDVNGTAVTDVVAMGNISVKNQTFGTSI